MSHVSLFGKAARSRPVDALRATVSRIVDRLYGMRTEQSISLEDLGLAHPNRLLYVPSSWKSFRALARELRPTPQDTFLDLGSGKGRVVLMMARRLRLRRIVGVEISPDLTAIAAENLARMRARLKTPSVELVTSDAIAFTIPDDLTIAYIYSSFTGPIFQAVIASVRDSLPRLTGERLVVVLQRPTNGTVRDKVLATNDAYLAAQPWLTLQKRVALRSITGWRTELAFYVAERGAGAGEGNRTLV